MQIVKKFLESILKVFFKIFFLSAGKSAAPSNLQKTIDLYKGEGFSELFAKIRAWDAPYGPIEKLIRKNASVLDLGCGDGLLANYLALSSPNRRIYGIEINKNRVKTAYKGLKNTFFKHGNIINIKIKNVDVVILAHVLHHLPSKESQVLLISKISKVLNKNKQLIILEIDDRPILKYLFSFFTDAIIVPILFEGKIFNFSFYYRKASEWKKILTDLGFKVQVLRVHKEMPFSHVLIYAKKVN